MKKKNLIILATAGVVALGYAVVSTNAFADTSVVTPIPAVSAPATPTAAITPPAIPSIPSDISATVGIQAPSGLANSSLSTMPSVGDDDGDDQSGALSAGVSLNSDNSSDNDGNNSFSVGVSTSQSDDNGGDSQQNNGGDSQQNNGGQDGSGSDD